MINIVNLETFRMLHKAIHLAKAEWEFHVLAQEIWEYFEEGKLTPDEEEFLSDDMGWYYNELFNPEEDE